MIQENGMPKRFQLHDKLFNKVHDVVDFWDRYEDDILDKKYLIPSQAIGATDSSDPKRELYLGDLIGFNLDKKDVVGEIVWLNFSVWVRLWRNENTLSYLSMSHVLDYFKIKKLGSRYDLKMKEIWKKARLE